MHSEDPKTGAPRTDPPVDPPPEDDIPFEPFEEAPAKPAAGPVTALLAEAAGR